MKTKPLSQSEYPTPYITKEDLIKRAVEKEWYIHNRTPNLKEKISKGRLIVNKSPRVWIETIKKLLKTILL